MGKVIGIGETVTDIIVRNGIPQKMVCGGSCLNTMVTLGRCGKKPLFVSEVGDDRLGRQTLRFLADNNVDSSFVAKEAGRQSKLSLAFLNDSSDAEYEFFSDKRGDVFPNRLPSVEFGDIVIFGSFYALNPLLHGGLSAFLAKAGENGALSYYDVNFRPTYLSQRDSLYGALLDNFALADIVRGSDEDFCNIFGTADTAMVYDSIKSKSGCGVLIITRGKSGVDVLTPSLRLHYDVVPTNVVSTIGAGDTFNAGVVYSLAEDSVTQAELETMPKHWWDKTIHIATSLSAEVCGLTDNYISRQTGERLQNGFI